MEKRFRSVNQQPNSACPYNNFSKLQESVFYRHIGGLTISVLSKYVKGHHVYICA